MRRGEAVVVVAWTPPHVQKVNVNTSIAWATIFAWGLGCRGGSPCLHGWVPTAARIDKPHDDLCRCATRCRCA